LSGGNDTGSRKPSPLWTAQGSTELCNAATLTAAKGVSVFHDVDPGDLFARYITSVYAHGYVVGCSNEPYEFCPGRSLSRADMAVVIVRSEYGPDYVPPDPTEIVFYDVDIGAWYAKWVHQAWLDGYTVGCVSDPPLYCPLESLTRAELAVFMVRARHGTGYTPPPANGNVFVDLPTTYWGSKWGEAAFRDGIMSPCDDNLPAHFCPEDDATRAEMAAALANAKYLAVPSVP
jgi:hypothetical protein